MGTHSGVTRHRGTAVWVNYFSDELMKEKMIEQAKNKFFNIKIKRDTAAFSLSRIYFFQMIQDNN